MDTASQPAASLISTTQDTDLRIGACSCVQHSVLEPEEVSNVDRLLEGHFIHLRVAIADWAGRVWGDIGLCGEGGNWYAKEEVWHEWWHEMPAHCNPTTELSSVSGRQTTVSSP